MFLFGCAHKAQGPTLTSLHLVDRNGFQELISSEDRLRTYEGVDFQSAQPYQKISRVYQKKGDPTSYCIVTSYYESGGLWQSLEVVGGRAHGKFLQYHENGKLYIEANVIEGMGDLTENAKESWIFEGISKVWDSKGNLEAEIPYQFGQLSGKALHYHKEGYLKQVVPYEGGIVDGEIQELNENGEIIGKTTYERGVLHGTSLFVGDKEHPRYEEIYDKGLLQEGVYYRFYGEELSSISGGNGMRSLFEKGYLKGQVEYRSGKAEGAVKEWDQKGHLCNLYHVKDGKKHGEEWVYDLNERVKLYLNWYEDEIHGMVKSYYPSGGLESQKEYTHNKKNGPSLSWYQNGALMLMEEYENELLLTGKYFKIHDGEVASKVERGGGVATLYDQEGHFLKKITYYKGLPVE